MLHHADHAIGLDVSPSPSGKRLDAETVCDGNFADTWRAQLSHVLEVLSSDTSQPHVLFRVQNRRGEGCEDPSLELRAGGVSGTRVGFLRSYPQGACSGGHLTTARPVAPPFFWPVGAPVRGAEFLHTGERLGYPRPQVFVEVPRRDATGVTPPISKEGKVEHPLASSPRSHPPPFTNRAP